MEVLLTDDKFENFEEFAMYGKLGNSEEVLMAGKIDNLRKIAIDEQSWAKLDIVKNTQSYARDATEIEGSRRMDEGANKESNSRVAPSTMAASARPAKSRTCCSHKTQL